MARYRLRCAEVDAQAWQPGRDLPGVEWYQPPDLIFYGRRGRLEHHPQQPYAALRTESGWHPLRPGDVIVTTPDGRRSVLAPDEFAALYEPADEQADES